MSRAATAASAPRAADEIAALVERYARD
jgi:hypothetical protein